MTTSASVPKATQDEANIWIVLVIVLVVLVSVWFVLKLGDDPTEAANLPEEAMLAAVTQQVEKPWLGADVQPIAPIMMKQMGLPGTQGVIVSYIYPGSPAESAGLRQGDVIQRVGERPVRDVAQLGALVAAKPVGGQLRLVVWQRGMIKNVQLQLGNRPPPKKEFQATLPEAIVEIEAAWLGLDIVPLTPAEAEELGLPQGLNGMVVDAVAAGTGVDAGFLVGDVIVAVNGKKTSTVRSFKEATEGAVGAVVDVVRFGRHIYISVPPPGSAGGGGQTGVKQVGFRLW